MNTQGMRRQVPEQIYGLCIGCEHLGGAQVNQSIC